MQKEININGMSVDVSFRYEPGMVASGGLPAEGSETRITGVVINKVYVSELFSEVLDFIDGDYTKAITKALALEKNGHRRAVDNNRIMMTGPMNEVAMFMEVSIEKYPHLYDLIPYIVMNMLGDGCTNSSIHEILGQHGDEFYM